MEKGKFIEESITINAPASKVWDALTKPEWTRQYMFGCNVISDWKVGSLVLWNGAADGKTYVKGEVVSYNPGKMLQYTTFDPNNPEMKDVPSNYLTVTYKLSDQNSQTVLQVSQGDYSKVVNGDKRYEETVGGWDSILLKIKELVER